LCTGVVVDAAFGPYSGKGTGETALFRQLLDNLEPGDLIVADSYYCTYWLLAECQRRGVFVVMRNHHLRPNRPADAKRLGPKDHLVTWQRPPRPQWMSVEEYEQVPERIQVRLV